MMPTFTTSGMGEFPPGWVANRCPVEVECVNLMWLNALKKGTQHQGEEKNDGGSFTPIINYCVELGLYSMMIP